MRQSFPMLLLLWLLLLLLFYDLKYLGLWIKSRFKLMFEFVWVDRLSDGFCFVWFFSLFLFFWPRFPSLMAVSFPCSLKGSAIDCIGCTEFPSKNFELGFGSNRFWLIPSFTNFLSKEKNCDCHLVVFIFSILVRLVQLEPTGISWISANQLSNGIWVIWVQLFVSLGLPDDVVINRSWARYRKWVKRGGREGAVTLNYECYILFTLDMRQIGCQPTMIIIDGHHWTSIPL